MLGKYLKDLLTEWIGVALGIADIIIFIVSAATQSFTLPREFYLGVAAVAFLVANFGLYSKLSKKVNEFEDTQANISIRVVSTGLYIKAPIRTTEGKVFTDGLDKNLIPVYQYIQAYIKVENVGQEAGILVWSIDEAKTKLPDPLQLQFGSGSKYFYDEVGNQLRSGDLKVKARERVTGHFRFKVNSNTEDVKNLQRIDPESHYYIPINYYTKRIGSNSKHKTLEVKGPIIDYLVGLIDKITLVYQKETLSLQDPDLTE
ncbi:MAG: hypothetical protein HY865_22530 [Chloroflexi bacterium]|nr:hypothetical protein [Chloroflexota bacterium]